MLLLSVSTLDQLKPSKAPEVGFKAASTQSLADLALASGIVRVEERPSQFANLPT